MKSDRPMRENGRFSVYMFYMGGLCKGVGHPRRFGVGGVPNLIGQPLSGAYSTESMPY